MSDEWDVIVPSALVTRESNPEMAELFPDTPLSVSSTLAPSAEMSLALELISPSALVTLVSSPEIAVALPDTPAWASSISLPRAVI